LDAIFLLEPPLWLEEVHALKIPFANPLFHFRALGTRRVRNLEGLADESGTCVAQEERHAFGDVVAKQHRVHHGLPRNHGSRTTHAETLLDDSIEIRDL
jgi:hypothetical protein